MERALDQRQAGVIVRRPIRTHRNLGLFILAAVFLGWSDAAAQLADHWRTDFSKHIVPLNEIVSGGPPKDGIPPIDNPKFISVRDADAWLDDDEPVVVVSLGRDAKAYPLQILMWHEIVNDEVAGIPVTVTFCPLCNTALSFDRRFDGQVLDFGTTGRLRYSDLVMYDRQTETWWQQATGQGLVGDYAGERLEFIASPLVSWETFKRTHPKGRVLSRDTGHSRTYGSNPYVRYDELNQDPYESFFDAEVDRRLPAKERVVALSAEGVARAYPFSALRKARVINDTFEGRDIVVVWAPGTTSALDAAEIRDSRDVGASGVFNRRIGDRVLTFTRIDDGLFMDEQTGSTWNVLGMAVSGPLQGLHLESVPHGNHFWFAWAVFMPETEVITDGIGGAREDGKD